MNKKLICMAIFGSLFTKSFASQRFLRAPEDSEDLVNSIVDSVSNLPNDIPLNFWPSEEASLEMTEELAHLFENIENAENGEDFGEVMGEDITNLIATEQDFSLLEKITQLEKIAVPALTVAGLVGGPTTAASIGAVLALGELINEGSAISRGSTAVLAGTAGSIADQALGGSGNAGTGLVNSLGANTIGNLVKDLLNTGTTETDINNAVNTVGNLVNATESEEIANQLESNLSGIAVVNEILGNASSESLISNLGDVLEGAGDNVKSVIDEVKEKAEDLGDKVGNMKENLGEKVDDMKENLGEKVDDMKENLGDKMKEAAGKIGKFFGKN